MIGGVYPAGEQVDLLRQLFRVGRAQLGDRAVFQNQSRQVEGFRQLGQHRFIGGGLALGRLLQHRQVVLVVEDGLNLLGRAEIERAASRGVSFLFKLAHALLQFPALFGQHEHIHQYASALDTGEHRHQRHFQGLVNLPQGRHGAQAGPELPVQAQRDIGILRGVVAGLRDADLFERNLLGALAGHVLVGDRGHAEVMACQRVHVMPAGRAIQHIGFQHGVVANAPQRDAVIGQHMGVVLEVLAELGSLGILQ